jgi:hypothetical protein
VPVPKLNQVVTNIHFNCLNKTIFVNKSDGTR